MKNKISPGILSLIILLMVTFILVQLSVFGFFSNESEITEVATTKSYYGKIPRQETEAGMYRSLHDNSPVPRASTNRSKRRGKTFYKNRAYMGAPPRIPHNIEEINNIAGIENCLQCHQNGSYSVEMKAYAPITPHPEYVSCRQCHVPQQTKKLFKPTRWTKVKNISSGRRHLPGSPPVIPHSLQLRENCLSCHLGEGAVEEIKVSHPERTNCRQCHVETNTTKTFERDNK